MKNKRLSISGLDDKYSPEATLRYPDKLAFEFIETNAYISALSADSPFFVLVGEKGAGKSTILRRLFHTYPEQVVNIQFIKFFNIINQRIRERYPSDANCLKNFLYFQTEWEIEIWVQIIKALYRQLNAPVYFSDNEKIQSFLRKHDLLIEAPWTERVMSNMRILNISWTTKDGKELTIKPAEPSKVKLESIEQINVTDSVTNLLQKKALYVFIDEIDDVNLWDETVEASLRGLLIASQTIIGIITQSSKNNQEDAGLRIRIAMRNEMFEAANNYVSGQKVIDKPVKNLWIPENLQELIVKPIRSHWRLGQNEISKQKLFVEIFPHFLPTYQQYTWNQFCNWSRENPRALFALLSIIIKNTSERQQAYLHSLPMYGPMYVTSHDIDAVVHPYSKLMIRWLRQSYQFIFPGIDIIIDAIRMKAKSTFRHGSVSHRSLTKFINSLLDDSVFLSHVKKWPDPENSHLADEVIRRLCQIGFFIPKRDNKGERFFIAPMYQPGIMEQTGEQTSVVPEVEIQNWFEQVLHAADELKNAAQLPKSTEIPMETEIPGNVDAYSQPMITYYDSGSAQSIRYKILVLFWTMRRLQKMLIAYGDRDEVKEKIDLIKVLELLDNFMGKISLSLDISLRQIEILSILLNSTNGKFISEDEYATSLEHGSEAVIFWRYAKDIKKYVNNLLDNRKGKPVKKELANIISELSSTIKIVSNSNEQGNGD